MASRWRSSSRRWCAESSSAGHRVERLGEVAQLARAGRLHAAVEVAARDLARGADQLVERAPHRCHEQRRSGATAPSSAPAPATIAVITDLRVSSSTSSLRLVAPLLLPGGEVAAQRARREERAAERVGLVRGRARARRAPRALLRLDPTPRRSRRSRGRTRPAAAPCAPPPRTPPARARGRARHARRVPLEHRRLQYARGEQPPGRDLELVGIGQLVLVVLPRVEDPGHRESRHGAEQEGHTEVAPPVRRVRWTASAWRLR